MEIQDIFDKLAERAKVPVRSVLPRPPGYETIEDACRYRGPNGLNCFVGVLLADEEYSEDMEGYSVGSLEHSGILPARLLPHVTILATLQHVHDRVAPENWPLCLARIASNMGAKFDAEAVGEAQRMYRKTESSQ